MLLDVHQACALSACYPSLSACYPSLSACYPSLGACYPSLGACYPSLGAKMAKMRHTGTRRSPSVRYL